MFNHRGQLALACAMYMDALEIARRTPNSSPDYKHNHRAALAMLKLLTYGLKHAQAVIVPDDERGDNKVGILYPGGPLEVCDLRQFKKWPLKQARFYSVDDGVVIAQGVDDMRMLVLAVLGHGLEDNGTVKAKTLHYKGEARSWFLKVRMRSRIPGETGDVDVQVFDPELIDWVEEREAT